MTAPKRHQPKVVRNFARNPRRIPREQATGKQQFTPVEVQPAGTDTLVVERPVARPPRKQPQRPNSITRQDLIDEGLLKPGKVKLF